MNILLTGGSGFIGRNICEQFQGKHRVYAPAHAELDLLDPQAVDRFFAEHTVDAVIHAANIDTYTASAGDDGQVEKSLRMFFNLARHEQSFKKLIFFGSGAEYDKSRGLRNVTEEECGEFVPQDHYGFSKFVCGQYIERSERMVNLRCFGVYGKYEDYTRRFISGAIREALAGKPITIRQNVEFDYVYIGDLVRIIEHVLTHEMQYKSYNAVRGQSIDLVSLANIINRLIGSDQGVFVEQQGLNKAYTANNDRLMKEIPHFAFTDHATVIHMLIQWYKF